MSLMVILAVGVDTSLLEIQSSVWKSAGYVVTFAWSIKDAIIHFRYGDFDLVLLGQSLPTESRERLTFLIRASGSRVPVVSIANSSSECDSFADMTIKNEPGIVLEAIRELTANRSKIHAARSTMTPMAI